MGLVAIAPFVDRGDQPSADAVESLTAALDEVLARRFNRRSWLVFASGTSPDLPLGTEFLFGTASNLRTSVTPYDFAHETPPAPVGGAVASSDPSTRVVWVTGYAAFRTLNRQHTLYTPPAGVEADYWFGFNRPERWEPLALADILVEDYLESFEVATPSNTVFNLRNSWDRFGCVRIHNGNRFPLLVFNLRPETSSADEWTIPPYGILAGRRDTPTGRWTFDRYYLPHTHAGDEMRYGAPAPGQFAASLELAESLVRQMGANTWARVRPSIGTDSSEADLEFYAGHLPIDSDPFVDWMLHRGQLLSVVLDKRGAGTVTITPLTWQGIGSIPDAAWSGQVTVAIDGAFLEFTSAVTPPAGAGPTEWEHDLIPVSSNVTTGLVLPLRPGTYAVSLSLSNPPFLSVPIPLGAMQPVSTGSAYGPRPDVTGGSGILFGYTVQGSGGPVAGWGGWTELLGVTLPNIPAPTGYDSLVPVSFKTLGGLVKSTSTLVDPADAWGVASFTNELLVRAVVAGGNPLEWLQAEGFSYSGTRRGWVARVPRRHMTGGAMAGGVAVHDNHPWDTDTLGTPDGLGLALGWTPLENETSGVQIEGAGISPSNTALGRPVYLPTDPLDYILENIATPGWWKANRTVALGMPEAARLRSMRLPRTAEHFNDLAQVLSLVQWVARVDIRDLHKDPPPPNPEYPFNFAGEAPFAVPRDWAYGRYDGDGAFLAWCTAWGVTPQSTLIGLGGLRAIVRNRWGQVWETRPGGGSNPMPWGKATWKMDLTAFSVFSGTEVLTTINGFAFSSWRAFQADQSRLLYGGAGTDADYLWVTGTMLHSTFDLLGVDSPPVPTGEEYVPRISNPANDPAIIEGTIFGTLEHGRDDRGDAQQAYRDSIDLGDGTFVWIRTLPEFGAFRLLAPTGTASSRIGTADEMTDHTTPDPASPGDDLLTNQVMVWEVNEGAEVPLLGNLSGRGNPPLDAEKLDGGVPIWPEVASFKAPFKVLVVGTGMPGYYITWDDHDRPGQRSAADSTRWQDPYHFTAPGIVDAGQLFNTATPTAMQIRTAVAAAGTLITPAWLQAQGWPVSTAYHVQWMRLGNQAVSGFLNDA